MYISVSISGLVFCAPKPSTKGEKSANLYSSSLLDTRTMQPFIKSEQHTYKYSAIKPPIEFPTKKQGPKSSTPINEMIWLV